MSQIWEFIKPLIRWVLLAILVLVALALMVRFLGIQPPREFTIATGREGGAYYNFAQQYQQSFAEEGYTLHIRPTAGSIETIQLLNSGEVDAGLVQNTLYTDFDTSNINILAAVFNEALWIFYRQDLARPPEHLADLKGLRIGVGEEGSGTLAAGNILLSMNGVTASNSTFVTAPSSVAAEQLKDGELDVMLMVTGAASPLVNEMFKTPGIDILPIRRGIAYTSRLKNVSTMVLGEGTIDLEQNIPSENKQLLVVAAALVANKELHPDLARLLLIIANEVHYRGGILEDTRQFPAPLYNGLTMNADAARYLENGPTGLERYLPLWLASRLERLLFLLLPVVLIAYPLIRGAPSLVAYFNRYRVKRRYVYLRNLEQEYMSYDLKELAAAIEKLETFQRELNESVNVPTSMLDEYYELRMHTGLTLDRLRTQQAALKATAQSSA